MHHISAGNLYDSLMVVAIAGRGRAETRDACTRTMGSVCVPQALLMMGMRTDKVELHTQHTTESQDDTPQLLASSPRLGLGMEPM